MNFVIMVLSSGDVRTYRSVNKNNAAQLFNTWRTNCSWSYLAKGDDFNGVTYSERHQTEAENNNAKT